MDKKKLVLAVVIVVGGLFYLFSGKEPVEDFDDDLAESEPTPVVKEVTVEPTPVATATPIKTVVVEPGSKDEDLAPADLAVKKELTETLEQVGQEIDACRKELQGLVTEEIMDGELETISTPESAMNLLGSYYELMVGKFQTMGKLNQVVNKVMDSNLKMKDYGNKLLGVKDCGDFEEHSLLASIAEASAEYNWPANEKKRIVGFVLDSFKGQTKLGLGLPHVAIKIGALSEFLESGLIGKKYKADVDRLIEKTQESQQTMQSLLPDDHQIGTPVDKETSIVLRDREKEEVQRLNELLTEVISSVQSGESGQ